MRKAKLESPSCCWIWHRWELVADTGSNKYHECPDCGSRYVRSVEGSDPMPIDAQWLAGAVDTIHDPQVAT